MTIPGSKVLDSWAMIAWAADEPGAVATQEFLDQAECGGLHVLMSALNVGETFYILAKRRGIRVAEAFLKALPSLPVQIDVPDLEGIMAAARIKASKAVAYGDSFAIALAQRTGSSVITGDREIRECSLVRVDWIGDSPHKV